MENQLTNNANALRLFFTEDVYLLNDKSEVIQAEAIEKPFSEQLSNSAIEANINKIIEPLTSIKVSSSTNYGENGVKTATVEQPITQPRSFKFLGGNKKSVLILVNDINNDVSTEQGRGLLRKIVESVELKTPDFALLNYALCADADFAELKQFFKPQILLAFGVTTNHLKLDLNWQNQILVLENTKMIFAPNLHDLDADLTAKKVLWANLQIIK